LTCTISAQTCTTAATSPTASVPVSSAASQTSGQGFVLLQENPVSGPTPALVWSKVSAIVTGGP
jgi:hypothetical protein